MRAPGLPGRLPRFIVQHRSLTSKSMAGSQNVRYQYQGPLLYRPGLLAAHARAGARSCCGAFWSRGAFTAALSDLSAHRPSHLRSPTSKLPPACPVCAEGHSSASPRLTDSVCPPVDCSSKSAALSFHEGLTEELRHLYQPHSKARAIRTSVVCPAHFKSDMFAGFVSGIPEFLAPSLEVDTVAELVEETILSGESQVSSSAFSPAA